jgi:hypothetical protein
MTDYLQIHHGQASGINNEDQPVNSGQSYFLIRSSHARQMQENGNKSHKENVVHATFDIDPSVSMIEYEQIILAEYLKDRYVTIDIFESETKFYFGSCKIPLFEILRQGKPHVVRAKECEVFNPENNQYKGFLQVIVSNMGKPPSQKKEDAKVSKSGKQPSQN